MNQKQNTDQKYQNRLHFDWSDFLQKALLLFRKSQKSNEEEKEGKGKRIYVPNTILLQNKNKLWRCGGKTQKDNCNMDGMM